MSFHVSRRGGIDPFIVLQVLRAAGERAAAGKAVFPLQIGQPSTPAPAGAREAAKAAIDGRVLGYTDAPGIDALRRRIALHYREHYGEEVAPERVFVTTGSSGGFVLAFLAAFDAGARVVLTDPSYPCYRNMLGALGIETVQVPTGPDTRFQPTPELLERVEGPIDGLVVASPSNPTGSMLAPEALARLAAWCHDRGVRLVSDEIYHGIAYGMEEATAVGSPSAITVNSFSKYFSMTGWRVGWLVLPEDLTVAVERLGQNLFLNTPTVSQYAALAAFDCREELEGNVRRYARNREILLSALPAMGIPDFAAPDGAFYVYADIGRLTNDSMAFCRRLLDETGVAITPGVDFDRERGSRAVRLSYCAATEDVEAAMDRLAAFVSRAG